MVTNDKQYMRDYYQRNKHRFQCKYSSTIYCEDCDTSVVKAYWHRHIKTKKHNMNENKDLMNNTCNDEDQLGNEDIVFKSWYPYQLTNQTGAFSMKMNQSASSIDKIYIGMRDAKQPQRDRDTWGLGHVRPCC